MTTTTTRTMMRRRRSRWREVVKIEGDEDEGTVCSRNSTSKLYAPHHTTH
jgi:hypothetical protein